MTGLRSNAEFHLGNYLGAIMPMVELQKKHAGQYQLNMFIPDLHSFTTPIDHGKLYQQTMDNLKVFVAAGLDIEQTDTYIYRQSYIPAHSEMTLILNCFCRIGELSRMTQFKEKGQSQESSSVGLFNYPVLMASDILLYGAKWVPVGEDQRQHVEFTRDIAIRMNSKFGELFVVPEDNQKQMEFAAREQAVRIRSLRNPDKKMSKSVEDPAGTILLSDSPAEAAKKIMSATTDSEEKVGKPTFDSRPGVANLLQILSLISPQQPEVSELPYKDFKELVADSVSEFLANFQNSLKQVDEQKLISKLESDETQMAKVAGTTLLNVQKAVGLRPKDR